MEFIGSAIILVIPGLILIALVFLANGLYHMLRMTKFGNESWDEIKGERIDLRMRLCSIVFYPEYLNEEGITHREKGLLSFAMFLGVLLTISVMGIFANLLIYLS